MSFVNPKLLQQNPEYFLKEIRNIEKKVYSFFTSRAAADAIVRFSDSESSTGDEEGA